MHSSAKRFKPRRGKLPLTLLPNELRRHVAEFLGPASYFSAINVSRQFRAAFFDSERAINIYSLMTEVAQISRVEMLEFIIERITLSRLERGIGSSHEDLLSGNSLENLAESYELLKWFWENYPDWREQVSGPGTVGRAASKNIESLKFLHEHGVFCEYAIATLWDRGEFDLVRWEIASRFPINIGDLGCFAMAGQLELFKLAEGVYGETLEIDYEWCLKWCANNEMGSRGQNRQLEMVRYLLSRIGRVSEATLFALLGICSIEVFQIIFMDDALWHQPPFNSAATHALSCGNLAVAEALIAKGLTYNSDNVARTAAATDVVCSLKWLRERQNMIPQICVGDAIFNEAAAALEYLLEIGLELRDGHIAAVVKLDNPRVAGVVYKRVGPSDGLIGAAEVLVERVVKRRDLGPGLTLLCAKAGRLDLLKKLIASGYPWDQEFVKTAMQLECREILNWAIKQHCPRFWDAGSA
jgi:hypothetical protein